MVFVVFKITDSAQETISEIDHVKSRLTSKAFHDRLQIKNWTIYEGIPKHDIIWPNITKIL